MKLFELFNKDSAVADIVWNDMGTWVVGTADMPDDTQLDFEFTNYLNDDNLINFAFNRDGDVEQTGQGSANAVFATMFEALRQYFKFYSKPMVLIFYGQGDTRNRIYGRFAKNHFPKLGFIRINARTLKSFLTSYWLETEDDSERKAELFCDALDDPGYELYIFIRKDLI